MSNDVAILLDLDNAVIGAAEAHLTFDINLVLDYIKKLTNGRLVFRRSYGDWRQHHNMPKVLAAAGFELQTTVNQMSKNLADMQMVVDAMETLIEGHDFDTYVLVTGDRDFMPLVQALRKRGKVVIGIGVKHTSSKSLMNLCDKYVYYEDLLAGMQLQDDQVEDLLKTALEELLKENEAVPASALKQTMQTLSNGTFSQSRFGKMSFTKFLEKYAHLVTTYREDTTVYVQHPVAARPEPPPAEMLPSQPMSEAEVIKLIKEALDRTLNSHDRVRASVLKEEMRNLSQGRFDEAQQGARSFGMWLKRYPNVVELQQKGTTLYVARPSEVQQKMELHKEYQRALKQHGLRTVPAKLRLIILKEIIEALQAEPAQPWRQIVESIHDKHADEPDLGVSKSLINDVLRIAERANVLSVDSGSRAFSTTAGVSLKLASSKPFQDAVMRCDAAYLDAILELGLPFDLEEAAIALYDAATYARYLKIALNHYGQQQPAPGNRAA